MNRNSHLFAMVILATCPTFGAAAIVTYSDDTFNNSDWAVTVFQFGPGGSISGSQILSGGNPSSYREIPVTVNATSPPGAEHPNRALVWGFHERLGFSYDPSTQGAVQSYALFLDTNFLTGNAGAAGHGVYAGVAQNGRIYTTRSSRFLAPESSWTSKSLVGLTATDFEEFQSGGIVPVTDPLSHPVFSAAGASFTVGFVTENNTAGAGVALTNTVGYDNWQVEITPVPEPSTFALAAFGLLGLSAWGRRRRLWI